MEKGLAVPGLIYGESLGLLTIPAILSTEDVLGNVHRRVEGRPRDQPSHSDWSRPRPSTASS